MGSGEVQTSIELVALGGVLLTATCVTQGRREHWVLQGCCSSASFTTGIWLNPYKRDRSLCPGRCSRQGLRPAISLFLALLYLPCGSARGGGGGIFPKGRCFWDGLNFLFLANTQSVRSIIFYPTLSSCLRLGGGEIHYNQRSGSLASSGVIIKTPKKVQCRIHSKLWFPISYLLCLEEPFANLAVGKGSRGARMNACPVAFPLIAGLC